ncbi:sugar ABC transporter ATP-binding protein [Halanaerobium salsuginis]|jgi:ABC-type sugar transport system ATPase subunit|uniref:Allose ABC transporter ATP-binding protein n=1 Tax=Halanaerobium salsuginis TaxID=29563 RepID=A0A1I4I2K3_9FIRM|nr:sugar ABC transporter ATP-binding protein [Halanaerobium salsuginis]SFL48682.1 allose ABC transporter ATP-binding protein [Halanaerobium salsuginis]
MAESFLVEMKNVSKSFGGVQALKNVNFSLRAGEVHVLLGENGAGKSTLMKILSGVHNLSAGEFFIKGKKCTNIQPKEAQAKGVSIIHQELSLINELSIAENIFLGRLPAKTKYTIDNKKLYQDTEKVLARVGLKNINAETTVENLKISQKQLIEIAKALSLNSDIIIMDEPTSSLTFEEINKLFEIINNLKKDGVGIVFISHKLDEVMEVGDRVSILKNGEYINTVQINNTNPDQLVSMMVGEELSSSYKHKEKSTAGDKIQLKVENLNKKDRFSNINFEIYTGEILGFFGLIGAGRTEIARAIIGADKKDSGTIKLKNKIVNIKNPYHALKKGIGLIPENRTEEGFCDNLTIWQNSSLPYLLKTSSLSGLTGLLHQKREKQIAVNIVSALNLKCSSLNQSVLELSGGNQQKVVVGKWLEAGIDLFIFDEPTRGIDVGVKHNIYSIIERLANHQKSIMLISSELTELLSVSDRIAVVHEGKIVEIFPISSANKEDIMYAATTGKSKMGVNN